MPTKALKLAVLGASGRSGQQFVRQALEKGHIVTAVVRKSATINIKHENLTIKECESLTKRENLTPHFKGQEAVISCLGRPVPRIQKPWEQVTFLNDSIRAIIPAMRMANVNRFVAMSSWYLDRHSKDIPPYFRLVMIPLRYSKLIDDHNALETYIERECPDIDYTLVRPPALVDGPVSEKPITVIDDEAMYVPNMSLISRADVGRFMLSCLGTDKWNKKCPAIASD